MPESTLLFDVMDIHRETKTMLESIEDHTRNMTLNEKAAYEMGVRNTLAALKTLLCFSERPLHYSGMTGVITMDVEDLVKKEEDDIMEFLSEED
jgi:hypothetical protein